MESHKLASPWSWGAALRGGERGSRHTRGCHGGGRDICLEHFRARAPAGGGMLDLINDSYVQSVPELRARWLSRCPLCG